MYIFGVDIPLVELILAVGIIGVVILLEITIILILITFHMKTSKRLEGQISRLMNTLLKLEGQELKEIDKFVRPIKKRKVPLLQKVKKTVKRFKK